jgi:hypothetical protein
VRENIVKPFWVSIDRKGEKEVILFLINTLKLLPCETICFETPWNAFHIWISTNCDFT